MKLDTPFVDIDQLADAMLPAIKDRLEADAFPNVALGILDGQIRIQIFPNCENDEWREEFLWAMQVLGASVPMDCVAFVSDSYSATSKHKSDGSEWELGEMALAFQGDGPDKELVTESIFVNIVDRTGSAALLTVHYERQPDGSITFGKRESITEGEDKGSVGGYLLDGLRQAMLQEPIEKRMEQMTGVTGATFGLDREESMAHMMCAAVKMVVARGILVALGATSERQMEIIKDSFANGPFFGEEITNE